MLHSPYSWYKKLNTTPILTDERWKIVTDEKPALLRVYRLLAIFYVFKNFWTIAAQKRQKKRPQSDHMLKTMSWRTHCRASQEAPVNTDVDSVRDLCDIAIIRRSPQRNSRPTWHWQHTRNGSICHADCRGLSRCGDIAVTYSEKHGTAPL